ncbi:MAG: AAA family ATPase [Lactobacillaceae bacterium]|jgi:CYTH domain-containing protein/predicted ATPase|nr:AAA family ATPase [Lactobacillaceae bacterium]
MRVYEFVITGGPCAGKTTCLSVLDQNLKDKGFKVIVVPETATEVISSGIGVTDIPRKDFQSLILDRSLNKEETTRKAVEIMGQDTVILYDRGVLDSKAYMPKGEFSELLKERGLSEVALRDNYDAVFHLVTAADGAEEFYTLSNNKARSEDPELARTLDIRTRNAWVGHPHLRVVDNSTSFKEKISRLCGEVSSAMGLPVPIEIERKYLIERPGEEFLAGIGAVKQNILQTYLSSDDPAVERRIRQRGDGKDFSYYYTEKKYHSELGRIETERKISEKEYLSLLLEGEKSVRKDRYCFIHKSQYFELDIYPQWQSKAILEIELTKENQKTVLPEWVSLIKEVTKSPKYKNSSLAGTIGLKREKEI